MLLHAKMATLGDLSVEAEVLSSYTASTLIAITCEGSIIAGSA